MGKTKNRRSKKGQKTTNGKILSAFCLRKKEKKDLFLKINKYKQQGETRMLDVSHK